MDSSRPPSWNSRLSAETRALFTTCLATREAHHTAAEQMRVSIDSARRRLRVSSDIGNEPPMLPHRTMLPTHELFGSLPGGGQREALSTARPI